MTSISPLPYASQLEIIKNKHIEVSINPKRGGDVLSIFEKKSQREILWQTKSAIKTLPLNARLTQDPHSFYDQYPGGIQELFPNTADSTQIAGADLPFHGEACRIPWRVMKKSPKSVIMEASLSRSPIEMEKTISVDSNFPVLKIGSKFRNLSDTTFPYSWGFHPVFGDALLSGNCTVYLQGDEYLVHPKTFSVNQTLEPGSTHPIKQVNGVGTLPLRTSDNKGADLLYIKCKAGWLIARNESTGLTVTFTWDKKVLPFVWVWRECFNPTGFPWFGREDMVGLEFHSNAPASELRLLDEKKMAPTIGANEFMSTQISVAVSYSDLARQPLGVNSFAMPHLEGEKNE